MKKHKSNPMTDSELPSESLLLRLQAMVDNELPPEEIPELLQEIEGDHELRNEYIYLLQLKRSLSELPVYELRKEWYERFEKNPLDKFPLYLGGAFAAMYGITSIFTLVGNYLSIQVPQWIAPSGLIALGGSILAFTFNAFRQKFAESKDDRSYKDVMK